MVNKEEIVFLTADRVMIKQMGERVTEGGIIIPGTDGVEKPLRGTILGLGPEVGDKRLEVGDEILFGKYAGTEFDYHRQTVLVMRESDVVCIIRKASAETR